MQEKVGSTGDELCSAALVNHTDRPRGCGERGKMSMEGLGKKGSAEY